MLGARETHELMARRRRAALALALGAGLALVGPAPALLGQVAFPVYLDDSPAAEDGLARARELAAGGNEAEAVRVLQGVLDEEGDRVTLSPAGDPDLYISARERAHQMLLASPRLLQRYRDAEETTARRMFDQGRFDEVERTRLLTPTGYAAALRVAGARLESAQFWTAAATLRQVERHPERALDGGAGAALMARIARYLNDAEVWGAADRWAGEAQVAPASGDARRPVAWPEIVTGLSPMEPAGVIEVSGLLSKPLWSEALSGAPGALDEMPAPEQQADGAPLATAVALRVFPTVAGDTIYINTGEELSAWDRLTLSARWARKAYAEVTPGDARGGPARLSTGAFKDTSSVTAWGPWLALTTGVARENKREGDARVHVVDARTGADVWSAQVPPLHPALAETWVRGPAVIDEGVVIVAAVKHSQQRRLSSVQLVGLDVASGALVWRRPLGSAGALPYGASPVEAADTGVAHRGVLYRSDRVGVISAVETGTGRVLWARRSKPEPLGRRESQPWEAHAPCVLGDVVYTLSADRRRVLELDRRTGEEKGSIGAQRLGSPEYLLSVGPTLVGVSAEAVWAIDTPLGETAPEAGAGADDAEPGADEADAHPERRAWRVAKVDTKPNIRGRVIGAGDAVIVPLVDGALVAPVRPDAKSQAQRVRLDRPGVLVALPDQLVVADDWQMHTYLLWEVAERMLSARIKAEPDDPTPAVTYAELAHRAGRPESILPAADQAMAAIARGGGSEASESARRRLFRALMSMLDDQSSAPGARPAADPGGRPIVLTDAVRAGAVERARALASGPEERVGALMAAGAFAEARGDAGEAVAAYQGALSDATLAGATVTRRHVSSRADIEAARRLRRVVREHGAGVYAPFEAEASRSLDALLAGRQGPAVAEDFEALGRRYPVAAAAARAFDRAATLREERGEPDRAALALEEGLVALADSLSTDAILAGELSGRLVRTLERAGRLRAALDSLQRLSRERPGLALTERSSPIDGATLRDSLAQRLWALDRRPRVGPLVAEQTPQVLSGWQIVAPVTGAERGPAGHLVLLSQSGEVGVFAPAEGGAASGVTKRWSVPGLPGRKVVRVEAGAVYLSEDAPGERAPDSPPQGAAPTGGRTIERRDAATGAVVWVTPPFRSLFPEKGDRRLEQAAQGRTGKISTPTGLMPDITELIVLFDERTCALVERSGRAAAFDLETGRLLWTLERTAWRVHDAWLDAGALAIGGADPPSDDRDERLGGTPALLALDVRTGRAVYRESPALGQVRWVRVTGAGRMIAGLDAGLVCADAQQGRARWRVQGAQVRESVDAWVFDGRVVVMDANDALWQVEEEDGRVRAEALDSAGLRRPAEIVARAVGDRAVFATSSGVIMFGRDGAVVGRDARWGAGDTLPAAWCDGLFVAIDASAANPAAPNLFTMRQLSESSAAALSKQTVTLGMNRDGPHANPESIAAIDGRVLVSAGDVTVVYDAPAPAPGAPAPAQVAPGVVEPAPAQPAPAEAPAAPGA